MARPLVTEEFWQMIRPLLPARKHRRPDKRHRGGRPPLDDRKVLAGVVFVLKTGIPWEYLPQEMSCGSCQLSLQMPPRNITSDDFKCHHVRYTSVS